MGGVQRLIAILDPPKPCTAFPSALTLGVHRAVFETVKDCAVVRVTHPNALKASWTHYEERAALRTLPNATYLLCFVARHLKFCRPIANAFFHPFPSFNTATTAGRAFLNSHVRACATAGDVR